MHKMQTSVSDDRGVRPSVCLSRGSTQRRVKCVRGHSVQPLPNRFGLLLFVCTECIRRALSRPMIP